MRRKTAASDRSDPQTHDAGSDGHAALLALPITDPYDITTPFDSVCGLTRRKGKGEEIDRKIARRKLSRVIPTETRGCKSFIEAGLLTYPVDRAFPVFHQWQRMR